MPAKSMQPLTACVEGIGLLGPGFNDWPTGSRVLAGSTPYVPQPTVLPAPAALPPAERRRTGAIVKLALAVGFEAASRADVDPAMLATVFTSSGGDGENCHEICKVLASDDRQVSPTRFHNSVHNAAAGYWSIATGATRSSNVICAFDASFGAGLLEALAQVTVDRTAVLLIACDASYPPPLYAKRPIPDAFGVALLLAPEPRATSLGRLSVMLTDSVACRMPHPRIEALRSSIPAARSLPVLRRLARREPGLAVIDYLDAQRVAVEVAACV
jgi:hypothetical protein